MSDTGKFDLFADLEESSEEERLSQEEYQSQFCQDPPEETKPGTVYELRSNLKLSIEDGHARLVCASCGKLPPWADDFMDCVSMGDIPVQAILTGATGGYPDYELDRLYIELKPQKEA